MTITLIFFGLLGLIIGSFVNVIIYRLPLILFGESLTLSWPPSSCPRCGVRIIYWHNIPLFGWLWLRGKSNCCNQAISIRYPGVEILTALLYILLVWQFGISINTMLDLIFVTLMVAMFFIDSEHLILPDRLTYPFITLAILSAAVGISRVTLNEALLAATMGFFIPWIIATLYSLLRRRAGMGMGDMKLLAGIAAWLGIKALFNIILVSSFLGVVVGILLCRKTRDAVIPFGPFLIIASAGWLFLYG